jgi:hypothetical protein
MSTVEPQPRSRIGHACAGSTPLTSTASSLVVIVDTIYSFIYNKRLWRGRKKSVLS